MYENRTDKKKICVSSLVLGIIGTVFSFFIPAVTYSCSVTGLAIGAAKSKKRRSAAGITLNIIAIVIAAVNSALAILMTLRLFNPKDTDNEERDES